MRFSGIPDVVSVRGSFFKSDRLWGGGWRGLAVEREVFLERTLARIVIGSEVLGGVVIIEGTGTSCVDRWERVERWCWADLDSLYKLSK